MADDMGRALAANGGLTVVIGGKECTVRPLGMAELSEVERVCLEGYKRQYLSTYTSNLDLLPEGDREGVLTRKLDEVARWDIGSLPVKYAHDPGMIKLTDELRVWMVDNLNVKADEQDESLLRSMTAVALDQETLTAEKYKELARGNPPRIKVSYVNWWTTGCFDGMTTMVWVCFRHNGVTRAQVAEELGRDISLIAKVSREIERLSRPAVGNG